MLTALITAGLLAALVLGGRFLRQARRAILELHDEISATARLMAQINVDLARDHFLQDNLAAAARFDALATRLETLAEQHDRHLSAASLRRPAPRTRSRTPTAGREQSA
jgi:hypothetical protein